MTQRQATFASDPDPIDPDVFLARSSIEEAEVHLERGDREAAVRSLHAAMQFDRFDGDTPLLAAMLRFEDGDLVSAARLALDALRIRPFHPSALNLLGVCMLDGGHAELAKKILRRVVRTAPGLRKAVENLRHARRAARAPQRERSAALSGLPVGEVRELLRARPESVAACVISRRSTDDLEECLDSLEEAVDEVVVVDATPEGRCGEIADRRAVTIHRLEGAQDLARLHDSAVRRSSADWVLLLEANERLARGAAEALRRAVRDPSALCHSIVVRDAGGMPSHLDYRLFRNAPGVEFVGSVLPVVWPALARLAARWRMSAARSAIAVDSLATDDGSEIRDTADELEQRASADARRAPGDPDIRMQLALVAVGTGDVERGLDILNELRAAPPDGWTRRGAPEAEAVATLTGLCLMRLERYEELTRLLEAHHGAQPATGNTLFLEGVAHRACGHPNDAVTALNGSIEQSGSPSWVAALPEVSGSGLPNMLGAALLDLGHWDEAARAFYTALEREPGNLEATLGRLALLLATGRTDEFLQGLDDLVEQHGEEVTAWTVGASLLTTIPALAPIAADWMVEACRRFPDRADLRARLGEAHLRCGHAEAALQAWNGVGERGAADMAARICACLCVGGDVPSIAETDQEPVQLQILGWLESWLNGAVYETLDRALTEIHRAEPRLPGLTDRTASWLRSVGQTDAATNLLERVEQHG